MNKLAKLTYQPFKEHFQSALKLLKVVQFIAIDNNCIHISRGEI